MVQVRVGDDPERMGLGELETSLTVGWGTVKNKKISPVNYTINFQILLNTSRENGKDLASLSSFREVDFTVTTQVY